MLLSIPKLVLLPGMDGAGDLFAPFIAELGSGFETTVVRYPPDTIHSRHQLINLIQASVPNPEPFVLLAESYSTPLAIECAAADLPNLKALILCAGFATSPLRGLRRFFISLLSPLIFRIRIPAMAIRLLLVGANAPTTLVKEVSNVVSRVHPEVLTARIRDVLACDVRASAAHVRIPTLYIRAEQDRLVPLRCLQEIQDLVRGLTVESIPAPHLLLQCEPRNSSCLVEAFLEQLEKSAVVK